MKIVDTDNFDGDYPDEKFVSSLPDLSVADALTIARMINNYGNTNSPRYYKVVINDYKLQPGFEP